MDSRAFFGVGKLLPLQGDRRATTVTQGDCPGLGAAAPSGRIGDCPGLGGAALSGRIGEGGAALQGTLAKEGMPFQGALAISLG